MVAGSLTYDTKMDTSGFQKGLSSITGMTKSGGNTIKSIIAGLGITKMITSAISVINNSIDGAIDRLDILNNFPKVMANLGISSEKSSKAIQEISDGLQGLPTTLQDGALAVQRFTSVNNDVEKSTKYFLAFNNAVLAGGAGTQIQASALEQLSQAYAKGKPDMMEWRTLLMAMPAQLKQVAQAMGYVSTDDLYEALKKGNTSMDEFLGTIEKLNKEGVGDFLSFEQQAKNSVDGIRTSITNAKTAVTRGLANVLDAVNKALAKTELKSIGNVISIIGKTAENVLKKIATAISKLNLNAVIKRIKNIYTILRNNIKKILETVINLLNKLVTFLLKNKNLIIGLVSGVLSLVAAFKGLKLVMSAIQAINMVASIASALGPIGLLTAGVVALGVAFGTALIQATTSLDGLGDAVNAQQTRWEELKEARQKNLEASMREIATTQELANELRLIVDENGEVKEGYENRAKYILGELNKALGTEYEMNGKIIKNYQDLKENIDQLITAKKAEAILDAYKDQYAEALTNEKEATQKLIELRQKYNEELGKKVITAPEQIIQHYKLGAIEKEIREQTKLIGEYGYTIQNYEELTSASVSGNADEIEKAVNRMATSYENATTKTEGSLKDQISNQLKYSKALSQTLEESGNMYESMTLSKEQRVNQERLNELARTLASQTSTVKELTPDQVSAWKMLSKNSIEAYNEGMSSLDEDTRNKIIGITGVVNNDTMFKNAVEDLAEDGTATLKRDLDFVDPVRMQLILTSDEISDNTSVPNTAAILAEKTGSSFNNNVNGKKWGSDLVYNISTGIKSAQGFVKQSAENVANIIKSILGHSVPKEGPLKDELTYMPDMIDNLVKGINDNKYKIDNAMLGLTSDMENRLRSAVNLEVGNMNATASVKSNAMYNSVINIKADFTGNVDIDGNRAGRILAPSVTKAIKAGGIG